MRKLIALCILMLATVACVSTTNDGQQITVADDDYGVDVLLDSDGNLCDVFLEGPEGSGDMAAQWELVVDRTADDNRLTLNVYRLDCEQGH